MAYQDRSKRQRSRALKALRGARGSTGTPLEQPVARPSAQGRLTGSRYKAPCPDTPAMGGSRRSNSPLRLRLARSQLHGPKRAPMNLSALRREDALVRSARGPGDRGHRVRLGNFKDRAAKRTDVLLSLPLHLRLPIGAARAMGSGLAGDS